MKSAHFLARLSSFCRKKFFKKVTPPPRNPTVPDPSIDCFNQCEYLPRENNSLSNKVDW